MYSTEKRTSINKKKRNGIVRIESVFKWGKSDTCKTIVIVYSFRTELQVFCTNVFLFYKVFVHTVI